MDSKPIVPMVKGAPAMSINKWKIDSIQIREKTYGVRPLKRRNSEPVFKLEECLHTFNFNGISHKELDSTQNSVDTNPTTTTKKAEEREQTKSPSRPIPHQLARTKPKSPEPNTDEPPVKKARSFPILPGDLKSLNNKGSPLPKQSSLPKLPSYQDLINTRETTLQPPPLQTPSWTELDHSNPEKVMLHNLTSKFFHFMLEKDRVTASQNS